MDKVVLVSPHRDLATNAIFHNRAAFAAHGLDIGLIYTPSGEPVVQAMLDGRAGYTHVCGAPVPAAVAGRGLTILAAFQTSSFGLFAHPEITSLEQLAGRRVALTGSATLPSLRTALQRHGLALDAVTILGSGALRALGGDDHVQKVLDGAVDAVSLNAPQSQIAMRAGLQCLLRFGDVYPIPTFALLVRTTLLQQERDQVTRFVRGTLQSIDDFIRDRTIGLNLLRQCGIPDDFLEGTYWEVRGYLRPEGDLPEEAQRLWIDWSRESLGLQAAVLPARVFDFSVLAEARDRR